MITLACILVTVVMLVIFFEIRKPAKFKQLYKETAIRSTSYPLIGHVYLLFGSNEDRMEVLKRLGREAADNKHGAASFWLATKLYTVISDPLALEKLMKTQMDKPDIFNLSHSLLGNGLIFAPVAIWHGRRKVMAPTMSQNHLNRFTGVFSKYSIILANFLEEMVDEGIFSIAEYFGRFTLNTITENVLGEKTDSQRQSSNVVKSAFDSFTELVVNRGVQPWLYSDTVYKLVPSSTKQKRNISILTNFINKAIQRKRNKVKHVTYSEQDLIPILDLLIESSGGELGYTDTELMEEVLVIFLAGMDTSAVAQGFIAVMLSRYPDIQDKVYEELQNVFGDSDRAVEVEDLPKLTYLDAVIRETMRLYPPVPLIGRKLHEETTQPTGLVIPAEADIVVNIWGVHHNPHYWGPDVEQFRPERFLEGPLHPYAWIPFSFGPRSCLGYRYAMLSIKTLFATLLRKYRFLPPDMSPEELCKPLRVKYEVMLRHVDDYPVRLQYRSE